MANSTVQCRICLDRIEAEHPDTIHGVNPLTRRWAWMCYWCCVFAAETLTNGERDRVYEIEQA